MVPSDAISSTDPRAAGVRALDERDYEAAVNHLTDAVLVDSSGDSDALLALAYFQSQNYEAAARHYRRALDHQPGGNHYLQKAIQPIEYIQAHDLGFCEGNVIKYVTRHKEKHGREDIEKAIHYLQFILEFQYDK